MSVQRKASNRLRAADIPLIKKLIRDGWFLNRIAALFDVNPGRISEIKTGKKFPEIPAAA